MVTKVLLWLRFPVWRELKLFPSSPSVLALALWLRFPVWRELKLSRLADDVIGFSFDYAFPFEGNWNYALMNLSRVRKSPLITLSRLKGIETQNRHDGEWFQKIPLITLSRLKGIETHSQRACHPSRSSCFDYAFPFEGNWNSIPISSVKPALKLWLRFPVWRELKLYSRHHRTPAIPFDYAFPFEGNWNHSFVAQTVPASILFDYAFPFEGNWN